MVLKIRTLLIVAILVMLFSGVAYGDNLLIGGILQNGATVEKNPNYQEIATSLRATYIPTYYGGLVNDVIEVRKAALGEGTVQNGLANKNGQPNEALKTHYDTIVAYSGGTSTAVTALADKAKYGLTCDTLILVSPMAAAVSDATLDKTILTTKSAAPYAVTLGSAALQIKETAYAADAEANAKFEDQIKTILKNNPDLKIIVIQSPQDKPTALSEAYQYTFIEGKNAFKEFENRITISNEELDSKGLLDKGINAHKDLFFEFAKTHLANDGSGITFSKTSQSIAKPNQLSGAQFTDYSFLGQKSGYGDHIGKEHDSKYVTYFDNVRKGYYQTPSSTTPSRRPSTAPSSTPSTTPSGTPQSPQGLTREQIEEMITRELQDENSQLVKDLQDNVNE